MVYNNVLLLDDTPRDHSTLGSLRIMTIPTMVSSEFHSVFHDNIVSRLVLFVCVIYDLFGDIVFII